MNDKLFLREYQMAEITQKFSLESKDYDKDRLYKFTFLQINSLKKLVIDVQVNQIS